MKQYPSINDKAMTIHLDNRQKVDLSATGGGRPTLRPLGHRPGRQHSSMEWFAALSHLSMFSNCFFNNNHNIIIIIIIVRMMMMMMMMIKPLPPVLRCVSKNIPLHFDNNLNKDCSSTIFFGRFILIIQTTGHQKMISFSHLTYLLQLS